MPAPSNAMHVMFRDKMGKDFIVKRSDIERVYLDRSGDTIVSFRRSLRRDCLLLNVSVNYVFNNILNR